MVDPKTVENMRTLTCSICDSEYTGWGNNAWPINEGRCCDGCNGLVLLERLTNMHLKKFWKPSTNVGPLASALLRKVTK